MIEKATIKEIESVNAFENMWKIQTNKTKFQIIPIGRQKCNPITIENTNYPPQNSGIVLGTIVSKTGFHSHIRQRIKLAKIKLPLLYRFINLSQSNKRTLYLTLVKSILTYPIVPLHTASKTLQKQMQTVQNKAARLITKTRLRESQTSQQTNELAKLQPLNLFIHQQAIKIWNKIEQSIPTSILRKTDAEPNNQFRFHFPTSRGKTNCIYEALY